MARVVLKCPLAYASVGRWGGYLANKWLAYGVDLANDGWLMGYIFSVNKIGSGPRQRLVGQWGDLANKCWPMGCILDEIMVGPRQQMLAYGVTVPTKLANVACYGYL